METKVPLDEWDRHYLVDEIKRLRVANAYIALRALDRKHRLKMVNNTLRRRTRELAEAESKIKELEEGLNQ